MCKTLFCCLIFIAFTSVSASTQTFFYTNPEHNGIISFFNITGRVKDKILVWQTNRDHPEKSAILVYDNDMKIKNRVNTTLIRNGNTYLTDFVATRDSLLVIYQYLKNNLLICELAGYNSEGLNTSIQQIDSLTLNSPEEFNQRAFTVIRSGNKQSFALVRAEVEPNETMRLLYRYYGQSFTYTGEILLPNFLNASVLEGILLDNNANILLALSSGIDSNLELTIYKINTLTTNVTNTLKKLPGGSFINTSFNLLENNGNYLACSGWKQDSLKGIFLWKVNNELSDVIPNTIITDSILNDSPFNKLGNFTVTAFERNNDLNIFLRSESHLQLVANSIIKWEERVYTYSTTESANMIALQRAADVTSSGRYKIQTGVS